MRPYKNRAAQQRLMARYCNDEEEGCSNDGAEQELTHRIEHATTLLVGRRKVVIYDHRSFDAMFIEIR